MDISELVDAVSKIVDDESFDSDFIEDLFTVARGEIAGEIDLPALLTVDTVTTLATSNSVDLPDTYSKGLFWVGNSYGRIGDTGRNYYDLMGFLRRNSINSVGQVNDVVVQGSQLLYQGAADDTLTLRFYAAPTSDEPDELPSHLVKFLLVNYACKEIFNMIEDGVEGAKANTSRYEQLYSRAYGLLSVWADKQRPREPKFITFVDE